MLKHMESDNSAYKVLLDDIFVSLQNFVTWEANWVPRNLNVAAHLLVRNASSISDICSWRFSPPSFLSFALTADPLKKIFQFCYPKKNSSPTTYFKINLVV